ncbi:MAG: hypothetical protein HC913_02150 [Microscillaceae bacterium]|nr:hypothetical protein [Microscillaceae bacterium]
MMRYFYLLICLGLGWMLTGCQTEASQKMVKTPPAPKARLAAQVDPEFAEKFLAHFKKAELPFSIDTSYTLADTIPADLVIRYVLEAAGAAQLDYFKDYWGDEESRQMTRQGLKDRFIDVSKNAFAVLNFGFGPRLSLHPDYISLVVHFIPTFMEGRYRYSVLLNYQPNGQLVDILPIGQISDYVDMAEWVSAQIKARDEIVVNTQLIHYGEMYNQASDYTEEARQVFALNAQGIFRLDTAQYSAFSGTFVAETQDQRFTVAQVFDEIRVHYAPRAEAPEEELKILKVLADENMLIAERPGHKTALTLHYDAHKATFVCQNEKGEKIAFRRQQN